MTRAVEGGLFLVVPTLALDTQGGFCPVGAETVNGLEHGAPRFLHEIVAVEDQGDRDGLAGGQNTEGACVVRDHLHLFADLYFSRVHERYSMFHAVRVVVD